MSAKKATKETRSGSRSRSISISKRATSFKLSDTALDILANLSIKRGIAKSAVIENLLRDEQQREVEIDKTTAWIAERMK